MRLGDLRPAGLGQRNQAVALVVLIRDHFDQPFSLERFDVVSQVLNDRAQETRRVHPSSASPLSRCYPTPIVA